MNTMNKILPLLLWMLGAMPGMVSAVRAEEDTRALLSAVDAVRAPSANFGFEAEVQTPSGDLFTLSVVVKDQVKSLVRYEKPIKARGRALLFIERNMWVYVPGTERCLRISPHQQALGGLASADIARVVFSLDYKVAKVTPENGRRLLALLGVDKGAAYARIELMIEADNPRPLWAVFYSMSGRKMKTAYFEAYSEILGQRRPTVFRVIDHIDGDRETVMRYSNYSLKMTPDEWFQPAQLKRLRGE